MRKRRTIILLCYATAVIVALAALLHFKSPPVLAAAPVGRYTHEDGYDVFSFVLTNRGTQKVYVTIRRNDAPYGAGNISTTMEPLSVWHVLLLPPPKGVPWSVDVLRGRRTGQLEKALRAFGARFRLCSDGWQYEHVQRIEIEK
jgi:hypothetical protein